MFLNCGMEDDIEFKSLAEAIRGARRRKGLSQKEAASRAGRSFRAWQDWEAGIGDAVSNIPRIEEALELDRGFFMAQLSVLERMFALEALVIRIEEKIDENSGTLRDVLGLLRIRGE